MTTNSLGGRTVRWVLAMPKGLPEAGIVATSVLMSVAFTAASLTQGEPTDAMRHWSLVLAVIVPITVSAPVGALLMHLLRELDLARLEAQRLSLIDIVTGLPNRRHWLTMAGYAQDDPPARSPGLVVMLLDIDDFKSVNDRFGHSAGDQVLEAVAGICSRSLRAGDFAARWGGEEFVILIRGMTLDDALQVANRIRTSIAGHRTPCAQGDAVCVTVSVGVADVGTGSVESALQRADLAMYRAKVTGKNRCVLAQAH